MLRFTGLSREIWRPKKNCGLVEPFNNNKTISGMACCGNAHHHSWLVLTPKHAMFIGIE